jgi:hypothetical protein
MCSSSLPARIICNDHVLANTLRGHMATIAPNCEVLSASDDCSQAPFCRWLGESRLNNAGRVQAALIEAIETLERSRHAFKSRELGLLRQRLVVLSRELSGSSE